MMVQPVANVKKAAAEQMREVMELEKTLLMELAEAKELALRELAELRAALANRSSLKAEKLQAEAVAAAKQAVADVEASRDSTGRQRYSSAMLLRASSASIAEEPEEHCVPEAPATSAVVHEAIASITAVSMAQLAQRDHEVAASTMASSVVPPARGSDRCASVRFAEKAETVNVPEVATPDSTDTDRAVRTEVVQACEEVARNTVKESEELPSRHTQMPSRVSIPKYGEQQSFDDFLVDNPEMAFDFDDLTAPVKPKKKAKAPAPAPAPPAPVPDYFDENPEMAFDFDDLVAPVKPKKKVKVSGLQVPAQEIPVKTAATLQVESDPYHELGMSATPHSQRPQGARDRVSTFGMTDASRNRTSTNVSEDYNVWTRTVAEPEARPYRRSELEQLAGHPSINSRKTNRQAIAEEDVDAPP